MNLEGTFTAIVTPFDDSDEIDEDGLRENIKFQIEEGVDAIVPVGTTGECATLSYEEHERVVEISVEEAKGKVLVIAGTGSNSTREALMLTEHAAEAGADAAMLVAPYYNKPTQRGLYEHYKFLAEEIDIPQIIYNIPSRTGRNVDAKTIAKLSKLDNIVGVKEASGDLRQVMQIIRDTEDDFSVVSGDDQLTLPIMSLGGTGGISVASNLVPGKVSKMTSYFLNGDFEMARETHFELMPLFKALFIETNPGPIKAAMNLLGMPAGKPRLPLVEVEPDTEQKLREVITDLGLKIK